jgi:hypothetical protein
MDLLAQVVRPSGLTHDGTHVPSLRVQLVWWRVGVPSPAPHIYRTH